MRKKHIDPAAGRRLSEIRQYRGISQGELAKALAVKVGTIQGYEHARIDISATRLDQLARGLRCETADLVMPPGAPLPRYLYHQGRRQQRRGRQAREGSEPPRDGGTCVALGSRWLYGSRGGAPTPTRIGSLMRAPPRGRHRFRRAPEIRWHRSGVGRSRTGPRMFESCPIGAQVPPAECRRGCAHRPKLRPVLRRTDSVAIEGIADIREALLPVGATRMTPLRHARLKTFATQKHCSFLR